MTHATMNDAPVGLLTETPAIELGISGLVIDLDETGPTRSQVKLARKMDDDAEDSARLQMTGASDYADLADALATMATGAVQVDLVTLADGTRSTVRLDVDIWGMNDADLANQALIQVGQMPGGFDAADGSGRMFSRLLAWDPTSDGLVDEAGTWCATITLSA